MDEQITRVKNLLENMTPCDTIIFSHADHDGFTASALLNTYFRISCNDTARILYPSSGQSYLEILKRVLSERPRNFVVLDSLIAKYKWLLEKIVKDTLIINLDHHDDFELSSANYVNANPHQWGIEYLNSSGLVWLILRKIDHRFFDARAWVAAVGALQDYCMEDNELLFETVARSGLAKNVDFESLLTSELMQAAKTIDVNCRHGDPEYVYVRLMKATLYNALGLFLFDGRLSLEYKNHLSRLQKVYQDYLSHRSVVTPANLIAYDFHGEDILFLSDICEKERARSTYVGYSDGLLTFRSLFCNNDVRLLAKLFGGGGPHPKAAGARTSKSFGQSIEMISRYLRSKNEQASISKFL